MVYPETAAQYARDRVLTHTHQLKSGVDPDAPFPLIHLVHPVCVRARTQHDAARAIVSHQRQVWISQLGQGVPAAY